jgi:hypothetical protein
MAATLPTQRRPSLAGVACRGLAGGIGAGGSDGAARLADDGPRHRMVGQADGDCIIGRQIIRELASPGNNKR